MIDPINSLAFSIQANKGVYAVLLGSGISKAAKIPTGWDVTIDLIRKLSEICRESCEPSPEKWYLEKYGHEPDYSEILGEIAKTSTERQQLLRQYWEPNEEEREEGLKQPTAAHRAIASLVEHGFVKVIITTNFDRLMEIALADVGITPSVISTPDQVNGALPLIHTLCCVFKVNGDYLDTRIRNTPEELSDYPQELDKLLDRIFDDFGLIVCGWSAVWDEALRNAMFRAPSRRFTTYWAAHGEAGEWAKRIIEHRQAQVIPITDANTFFQSVQEQVQSLEEFTKPHPLSKEAAVASLKRYISEPRFNIQFFDLVADQVEKVVELTTNSEFSAKGGATPDKESFNYRIQSYENICSTILAMASVGSFWAKEEHYNTWERALKRLFSAREYEGFNLWLDLQKYPSTLLFYVLALGAVDASKFYFLERLFTIPINHVYREDRPAVQVLPPFCFFEHGDQAKLLQGMETRYYALNDWLHKVLREYFINLIPDEKQYTLMFDKLEILIALGYAHHAKRVIVDQYWIPTGSFAYRHDNCKVIVKEIKESITRYGYQSPYVQSNIFGEDAEKCTQSLVSFVDFVKKNRKPWW